MSKEVWVSFRGVALLGLLLFLGGCDLMYELSKDRPTHPGREETRGEVLEFDRDRDGKWESQRKYSDEQKEQLKEYESRDRDC